MTSLPSRRRRRGAVGLGHTQKLVLNLLAITTNQSARDLSYNWPSLTESAARSAVARLGDRGLVDMAGWTPTRDARTYCLTAKGQEVADALVDMDPEGDDDDA
jgi:predicted ArsR family transcriptional regulator